MTTQLPLRFGLVLAVVLLDQLAGRWLMGFLQPSEGRWEGMACHPLLYFNPSFAWGLLPGNVALAGAIALGAGAIFLCSLGAMRLRGPAGTVCALLLGSLLSGVVDRLRYGSVVDFFVCGSAGFTFNGADLVAGAAVLLLLPQLSKIWRRRGPRNNASKVSRDSQGTV